MDFIGKAFNWVGDNWTLVIGIGLVLSMLGITSAIWESLSNAKKGLERLFTPLGGIIFFGLMIGVFFIITWITNLFNSLLG